MFNPDNFLDDHEIKSFFDSLPQNTPPFRNTGVLYEDITPCTSPESSCYSNDELYYQMPHSQVWQLSQQNLSYFSTEQQMSQFTLADTVYSQNTAWSHPITANMDHSLMQICPATPVSMGMPSPLEEASQHDQEAPMTMTQFPYQQYLEELAINHQLNSDVVQYASTTSVQTNMNQIPTHRKREIKHRTKFTKHQLFVLETEFLMNKCPKASFPRIAKSLNLSLRQVSTWFQNRKRKLKRNRGSKSASSNQQVSYQTTPEDDFSM
ncbi:unnamed protein product [Ceutorhynchus assimilis]|uniref:Homeobox domain-containing protein n=1 Tax=Ceutorhynchus assimilis TaxID=467358 RepID=A0A9N9MVN5_9CUCU|nr:unnamed protein product [Ceutorhynchus assimilis]